MIPAGLEVTVPEPVPVLPIYKKCVDTTQAFATVLDTEPLCAEEPEELVALTVYECVDPGVKSALAGSEKAKLEPL